MGFPERSLLAKEDPHLHDIAVRHGEQAERVPGGKALGLEFHHDPITGLPDLTQFEVGECPQVGPDHRHRLKAAMALGWGATRRVVGEPQDVLTEERFDQVQVSARELLKRLTQAAQIYVVHWVALGAAIYAIHFRR